jgi:S1-C subfamily serine protease
VVEPGDEFDDIRDEASAGPLLPPDDRLWRHPSELGEHSRPISPDALSARRSWMAATPSRAGAWSAGIVGALLATGVVLIGGHLAHLLSSPTASPSGVGVSQKAAGPEMNRTPLPALDAPIATTTTVMMGVDPGLYQLASRVATAMPVVFIDHKPSGVGVVVSPKGYVLVPASLVSDADDIGLFIDGQQLPATLVGVDPGTGLAVVRVHNAGSLEAVRFVSGAKLGSGAFVALVWMGNDEPQTCWGTVDELDVPLTATDNSPPLLESLKAFDPMPQMASGGVVIDGAGHLLGMVTSVAGETLIATPGWLADMVSRELISSGRVVHGWLGITGETASVSATQTAVEVLSVAPGGAAAKAGVKPGDLIEALDGEPIAAMSGIVAALYSLPPNRMIMLQVLRSGHAWDARARLTAAA